MNVNKTEVEHIASLARIKLDEVGKEKIVREMGAILGYIDKLKEINTEGIESVAHITGLENVMRKDEPNEKTLAEQASKSKRLIKMASEKKDNYVKVRAVFGD